MFEFSFVKILILAAIGLVIFGPDRLPKLISDGAAYLRKFREFASGAQRELKDAIEPVINTPELSDTMRDLASLHPKNAMKSLLDDTASPSSKSGGSGSAQSTPIDPSKPTTFDDEAT